MIRKEMSDRVLESIEQIHAATLYQVDCLNETLTNLRYEGKAFLGKNLKEIRSVLKFLNRELIPHVKFEEEFIFPFVKTHIPKLESLIHLLRAQHKELQEHLKNFESLLEKSGKEGFDVNDGRALEKIREQGIYINYLIQHHIQVENESIYKIVDSELNHHEKKELAQLSSARS